MTESPDKRRTELTETEAETVNKEDSEARGLQRQEVRAPACRKGTLKIVLKYTGERFLCFLLKKIHEVLQQTSGQN